MMYMSLFIINPACFTGTKSSTRAYELKLKGKKIISMYVYMN